MRNLAIVLLLAVASHLPASAQVFLQNTMYRYTRFVYNPAAAGGAQAGMEPGINLTLLGRQQWLGIEGAPRSSVAFVNGTLPENFGSIGATIATEQLGNWSASWLEVAYAFQFALGDNLRLNIGASGGFRQALLSGDGWVYNILREGVDPVVPTVTQSVIVPSLAAGVYLTSVDADGREGNFFVGLSGQNLLEPSIEGALGESGIGEDQTIPRSFTLMGGYRFDFNERSSLQPMVMLQADNLFPPQANLSLYWNYRPLVVGANYRFFNESVGALVGFNISDRAFFAYSYDFVLNSLNRNGDIGSHELVLSYTFPSSKGVPGRKVDILDESNTQ
ncbi:MAG: hypothetical protein OHK0039_04190 [Bacteroidia bacterium]